MRTGRKEVIGRWLIALLMASSAEISARAEEVPPDVLVRKTTEEVLNVVRSDKDIKAGNVVRIVRLIEEKVAPHFDFERMTRLAVGRPWRESTPGQREALVKFITRTDKPSTAEAFFRAQYGVSLRHLVPIAEPTNLSCNIVIHLGKGERFGWCFRWDHDGAWELEGPQPSFDAALAALTTGIERRDASVLRFLGIDD